MSKNKWFPLFLVFATALVFRSLQLEEKPLHHDESINGWFVLQMWKNGFYHYDPTNYHGPLFFYLVQLAEVFLGVGVFTLRFVPALFSSFTVGLFVWKSLVEKRLIWGLGALILLLSPAAHFFGRSGIHESIFVTALLVIMLSLNRWIETRGYKQIYIFIGGLSAAFALKETISIFVLSGVISWLILQPLARSEWRSLRNQNGVQALFWGGFALLILFTGFFQDWSGVPNFFAAYVPWLKTGVHGAGHEKPWSYWLEILWNNELPSLLLGVVALLSWKTSSRVTRFFTLWSFLNFALYSLIPYKTPWCVLSIQLPMVYAGCLALADMSKWVRPAANWLLVGAPFIAVFFVVPRLWDLNFRHPILMNHPFVYVQTNYEFKSVIEWLKNNRNVIGERKILVATEESWPLPWWLHEFNLIYRRPAETIQLDMDIQIIDQSQESIAHSILDAEFASHRFETRDSRQAAVIFVRKKLFEQMRGTW